MDFQEGAEVDVAEDVVFDEDTAQGIFSERSPGDFGGDIVEIEADDAELTTSSVPCLRRMILRL